MKHLIRSWIARAVLSDSLVAATVGASYGEDKVVRDLVRSQQGIAATFLVPDVSDLQRKPGS